MLSIHRVSWLNDIDTKSTARSNILVQTKHYTWPEKPKTWVQPKKEAHKLSQDSCIRTKGKSLLQYQWNFIWTRFKSIHSFSSSFSFFNSHLPNRFKEIVCISCIRFTFDWINMVKYVKKKKEVHSMHLRNQVMVCWPANMHNAISKIQSSFQIFSKVIETWLSQIAIANALCIELFKWMEHSNGRDFMKTTP